VSTIKAEEETRDFWYKGGVMRGVLVLVCLIIYFLFTGIGLVQARATEGNFNSLANKISAYRDCFISASFTYGVSYELLMAIAKVESNFNPRALGRNRNRSYDIGIMQINSSWLPYLRRYGIRVEHLWDPCYNIHIGAMVLRHCMDIYGNSWRAVDCYNKGAKRANNTSKYVWNVYRALREISESKGVLISSSPNYQAVPIFD